MLNPLAFKLSPLALGIIFFCSFTTSIDPVLFKAT